MKLSVSHTTHYAYDPPANKVALRLRLFPQSFEGQRVLDWRVSVNGETVPQLHIDGFGDGIGIWQAQEAHRDVNVLAEGTISTTDTAGVVKGLVRRPPPAMYLRQTDLTTADAEIRDLGRSALRDDQLKTVQALSTAVSDAVGYKAGVTSAETTAAQALTIGAGVCQDHAHVFVAAARTIDVPARYVTGYLLADASGEAVLETHAWAEAYTDILGWVAFDPSNRQSPTERYIRLGTGLDAVAAAPIRGTIFGTSDITLKAAVQMQEVQAQ